MGIGKKAFVIIPLAVFVLLACSKREDSSSASSSSEFDSSSSESSSSGSSSSDLSSQESSSSSSSEEAQGLFSFPDAVSDYYAPIDTNQTGEDLALSIHDLMLDTHTYYTTYGELRFTFYQTDGDPTSENDLIDFYTKDTYNATWDSSSSRLYDREHVWCKSLSSGLWASSGFTNESRGGGSDMFHIRPTRSSYNTARSNKLYGEVVNGTQRTFGYVTASVFEPFDDVKGNVARELFYIYLHYTEDYGGESNEYTGDLNITDIVSSSSEAEAWAMLLEWNELDPVEESETRLNDYAETVQYNRNPFIDCPELANYIWGVSAA